MSRRRFGPALGACVLAVATSLAAQGGPVRYVYDELGRLVAVIDGSGASATYHYDAVGNLLSITRAVATDVTIIEFTPDGGNAGRAVTIYGTGFSATPSQNSVSFNGTSAMVTASTANTIETTLPAGATTGPISITSPDGSANSATNFVVGLPSGPTITGFSPNIGTEGTPLTISGTNFETVLANNRVTLNLGRTTLSGAAAISLDGVVPPKTGSGRFTVMTPKGSSVSGGDFFVPPSPYTASSVATTGRLTSSTAFNVAIGTASKIGLVVFDGTAGQRVALKIVPGPTGSAVLYRPDLTSLHSHPTGIGTTLMEPPLLPATGTYQFMLDPTGSLTGTYAVTLYDVPPDITGTISADGATHTVTTTVPGQNATLTFAGTQGNRISLWIGGGPLGDVSVLKPDGTSLDEKSIGIFPVFMDATVLPASGTYSIFVNYLSANTGSVDLRLYTVPPDLTGAISQDGTDLEVTIGTPGQNASYTFSGTAGQRVSLRASSGPSGSVSLLRPDGTSQASLLTGIGTKFMEPQELATTGTYTVLVNLSGSATGSLTLNLWDVPDDFEGGVTIGGSAVNVPLLTPGQNGTLTFSGTTGQQVTVRMAGNTIGQTTVKLFARTELSWRPRPPSPRISTWLRKHCRRPVPTRLR